MGGPSLAGLFGMSSYSATKFFSKAKTMYARKSRHAHGIIAALPAALACGSPTAQEESPTVAGGPPIPAVRDLANPILDAAPKSNPTQAQHACMSARRDIGQMCREGSNPTALLQGTWCNLWGIGVTVDGDTLTELGGRAGWRAQLTLQPDEVSGWLKVTMIDSEGSPALFGPISDPCASSQPSEYEVFVYGRGHAAPALTIA